MKEAELRKHAKCTNCGKRIGHTGLPLFWRVTIERFGIRMDSVRRQDGLTAMLGGHARLASVMGPDENLAEPMMDPQIVTLCEECATKALDAPCIAELAEKSTGDKEST